jgi:hypothetical protein
MQTGIFTLTTDAKLITTMFTTANEPNEAESVGSPSSFMNAPCERPNVPRTVPETDVT